MRRHQVRTGLPTALALAGALVAAAAPLRAQGVTVPSDQRTILEAAGQARAKGEADAPLRIVEISDFQCPYCAQFYHETYPVVDSVYVRSGIARYLWISFPNSRHRRAWPAIEAAFCAGAAGRFWEMHDILFETQSEWSEAEDPHARFLAYAERAGIDRDSFAACLLNDQTAPLQVSDYESALRSGITSTPFFIVGDSLAIQGTVPPERFRAAVDSVLAARGLPAPDGAP
ncbi:MAG: thioredoxin domain-containing protein [Gemmatimonadales bacterium]